MPRSFASGSLRETEVAFELLRFGVGPERGSAKASAARSPLGPRPWSTPGPLVERELAGRLRRSVLVPPRVVAGFGFRRGSEHQARAQARKRRVRLGVEAIDRDVRALDQAVLLAQLERAQKEALEQRRIDEAAAVGVRERLVDGQPLGEAVAEEAAQIQAHARLAQQLPRRADPLERTGDHQLDEHDRVDRGSANLLGVVRGGELAHERPVDEAVELPVAVVLSDELIETHHLHLQRRRLPLDRAHRHPAPPRSTSTDQASIGPRSDRTGGGVLDRPLAPMPALTPDSPVLLIEIPQGPGFAALLRS